MPRRTNFYIQLALTVGEFSSYNSAVVSPKTSKMTDISENLENILTPTDNGTPSDENNQDCQHLNEIYIEQLDTPPKKCWINIYSIPIINY
jgi:hypothetical protein